MKLKEGVTLTRLHPSIAHALDVIDAYWWKKFGTHVVVTSLGDGTHSEGSLHYGVRGDVRCRALDFRIRHLEGAVRAQVRLDLRGLLGSVYDVVLESDHGHIEFDPKILD